MVGIAGFNVDSGIEIRNAILSSGHPRGELIFINQPFR
jgi:hypothetical protein